MDNSLKPKIVLFVAMISFMLLYSVIFGYKNITIGLTIILAAIMNLANDLSFKPKISFIRVLVLLLVLGIVSYFNYPLTLLGCILTFVVVFATTFTSYNLFGMSVYLPFLMCYFMMVSVPVTIEEFPMRLLSLIFGAVFIVGLNILVNKKKMDKLSKITIDNLISELNNAIDMKLANKMVSESNFKTVNGFYLSIFNKFEYKYFPSKKQQSVLTTVKAFQYIGKIVSDFDLTENELKYTKKILSNINDININDIFDGITIETDEMSLILLNLEIIANESNNDLTDTTIIPDRKTVKSLFKPVIKRQFSFKSAKFTFAFKMALILFVWQIFTLIFNLPFAKWLYFITLPIMVPYINDLAYTAKSRVKGTFIGIFIFLILIIAMQYIPISSNVVALVVFVVCMFVLVLKLDDKLILSTASTVMSVMFALMYIPLHQAIELKILWVVIGAVVVSVFNFKFLPYSVETETKNNLNAGYLLNKQSIDLIKDKCNGINSDKKTTVLVISNIVCENIEVTDENRELYDLQIQITDVCNFILNTMDVNVISVELKENLIGIIDKNIDVNNNLNMKDRIIAYSMQHVKQLYIEEKTILENLK